MNKTKKIYSAIYIVSRALFFVSAFALFFALLPPAEENGRRAAHYTIFAVCVLTGAALTVWGAEMKRRGLKNGVSPETFTPTGAQTAVSYFRLILMAVVIVFPFYVIVVTSLKTDYEAASLGFSWLPKLGASAEAYKYVFTSDTLDVTIGDALINTLKTSVVPTLASVFVSALSAYSFAKLEFRGKNALFGVLLLTMMTPGCITLLSSYLLYDAIGWTHSFLPLVVPSFFGAAGIVFFLREYFAGIPDDLLGSARLDGLDDMGIFFRIVMPLSVPAVVAQLVLTFVGKYNDFMGPLIYLTDNEMYTLQIYMRSFTSGSIYNNRVAAACAISIAPLLLAYLFLQKIILSGIAMSSGLKA